MPAVKPVPKKGLIIAKKGAAAVKKTTKPKNKRKKENSGYEDSDVSGDEDHANPASNDSNDVDMELIRVAFASAKSKHTKKQDAEFLRQQKALIESAREQAETIQAAGNAHLEKLVEQFESLSEVSSMNDVRAFATTVGYRMDVANELHQVSMSTLEQVTADYEVAIQAAGQEFQSRAACRDKIRRQTVRHVHKILGQGVEEQKVITDATELIKNFQRLMKV